MSLTMSHRSYVPKPSSDLQRGSTGAVKSRPFGNNSVGTSTRIMAKQGHSSTGGRILPSGPGPLPNRSMLDNKSGTVKFVTASSSTRDHAKGSSFNHVINHQKSNVMDSPTTRRKVSTDSGYGSSTGKDRFITGNYRYGELNGRKSKSLSQLNRDETDDLSFRSPNRSRTDSSSHGVSPKTGYLYSQNHLHVSSKSTLNGSTTSTSMHRSTTHSDYKDPKLDDRKYLSKNSSDKDLTNGYTSAYSTGKTSYSVIDVEKARKATITALPGTDLKCSRKSSFSSSNSSPSNSVSLVMHVSVDVSL